MSPSGHRSLVAAAVVALLAAGCSRRDINADFTSIQLDVVFSIALGIDALEVDVFDASENRVLMAARKQVETGSEDPQTEALTILLAGELAIERVRVSVNGLREEAVAASGETFVTLLLGDAVTASVALAAPSVCGNGQIEPTEACDDGGQLEGDGCSSLCEVEDGFICIGLPSACFAEIRAAAVDSSAICPGNGSNASPFCRLADAIATSWARTVLVRSGMHDGDVLVDRAVDVLGEPGAIIASRESPVIEFAAAPIEVAHLEIRGEATRGGGIVVSSGGRLLARNIRLGPSSEVAVTVEPGGSLELLDSVIANNRGGGVWLQSAEGFVLWNVVIEDNGAADADVGGVRVDEASPNSVIANATIRNNQTRTATVAGLACESSALVLNTILWDNGEGVPAGLLDCEVRYSDIGPLPETSSITLTSGNFSEDPRLDEAARLTENSPCIDRGDPDSVMQGLAPETDRDGEPRRGRIDVGADEF